MTIARTVYRLRVDATPEAERDALSAIYQLAIERCQEEKAAEPAPEPDGHNDVRKDQDAHTAKQEYT